MGLTRVVIEEVLKGKKPVMETTYEPSPTGIGRRRVKAVIYRFHLDYMERLVYTFPHVEMSPAAQRYLNSKSRDIYAELPIPKLRIPGFTGKLWNFQKVGTKWINDHVAAGEDCGLNDEMGLGKTVQVLAAIARKEYDNVLVVTTNSGKWSWLKIASEPQYVGGEEIPPLFPELDVVVIDGVKSVRKRQLAEDHQIVVINLEMLRTQEERVQGGKVVTHAFPELFERTWDLIVVDEIHKCFPGNTKILTEDGEQSIKSLVDRRYAGRVWTSLGWKPVTDWVRSPLRSHMVKIAYDGGELVCTTDHPVWTEERGYVKASDVRPDDYLRVVRNSTLYSERFSCGAVLQHDLFGKVAHDDLPRATRPVTTSHQDGSRCHSRQAQSEDRRADAGAQSYVFASYQGQGIRFLEGDGTWAAPARREWSRAYDPTNIIAEPTWQEVDGRVRGVYGTAWERLAESLHDRLGVTYDEDCRRGRWCFAQTRETASFRSETGPVLARARVASVEIYESGSVGNIVDSCADDSLYNLSVLDAEEYVADGVLVHNCKNPAAQVTKGYLHLNAKHGVYMSGTPFLNRPEELWPTLHRIDPVAWPSQEALVAELVIKGDDGKPMAYRPDVVARIKKFLNVYTIRRRKDQVVKDLPQEITTQVLVDLTPEQRALYDKIRDESLLLLDNGEVKSITAYLAIITRLKQACWSPELYEGSAKSAKLDKLKEDVMELIASGEKAIIFSQWKKATRILRREISEMFIEMGHEEWKIAYVDGDVKGSDRRAQENMFNGDDDCKLYIGTIAANQEAITLSAATYVLFTDKAWSPLANDQAKARSAGGGLRGAHLAGTGQKINVIEYFARETVDQWIDELLAGKSNLFNRFVEQDGGLPVTRMQVESLKELLTR
jgi:superfamily II DNA or RNA helicase